MCGFRSLVIGLLMLPLSAAASADVVRSQVFTGESRIRGLDMPARLTVAEDGRFRYEVSGDLARTIVFDGERLWRAYNGAPAHEMAFLEREMMLFAAWLVSGYWQDTNAPLSRSHGPDSGVLMRLGDGALTVNVSMGPGYAPEAVEFLEMPGQSAMEFASDPEAGTGEIRFSNSGPDWDRFRYSARQRDVEIDGARFTRPAGPRDFSFDPGATQEIETRRLPSGHLLVRAQLNDAEPVWLVFDTGGVTTRLSRAAAEQIGVTARGSAASGGAGGLAGRSGTARLEQFALGALRIRNLPVAVADDAVLGMLERMAGDVLDGEPIAGIVGWDVLSRSIVEIDIDTGRLSLSGLDAGMPASATPLLLPWQTPHIRAQFEGGNEGVFMLDTGAGSVGVMFHNHAVESLGLLSGRVTRPVEATGLGGTLSLEMGEIDWLDVGGDRLSPVPALFSTGADGESDLYTRGLLGAGAFGGKRVRFDYAGGRIAILDR